MWVAPAWGVRAIGAACLLLMGCLVTDEIEIPEEPFCPPSIVSPPAADNPLDEIVRVNLGAGEVDAGTPEETFEVTVRDCNHGETLTAHVFLDARPDFGVPGLVDIEPIEPTGGLERTYEFRIGHNQFVALGGATCHKVELLVSGEFSGLREPERPGDIATAVWWASVTDDGNEPSLASCP